MEINKNSCFIGRFFREYIQRKRVNRQRLAIRLNFDYADNDRMICFYLKKKDYLWKQFEVEIWCSALGISEDLPIYTKLISRVGQKSYDCENE